MRDAGLDPVLQAAATAFGFVYIHPFEDGNGRLHRCLIHHVLAERKFTPPGMIFPVSSVMLDRIDDYRTTLQNHSSPLMAFIDWRPTPDRNVEVLNDTADLYRYFDSTGAAEFLYACVLRTVQQDSCHGRLTICAVTTKALSRVMEAVEMPDRSLRKISLCLYGKTTGCCRRNAALTNTRNSATTRSVCVESIVREAFEGFDEQSNNVQAAPDFQR